MKLKMTRTFQLANPIVAKPHWRFKEGQILVTDDEYLIETLLTLDAAKIIDKIQAEDDAITEKEVENKKVEIPENKMYPVGEVENKNSNESPADAPKKRGRKPKFHN